VRQLAKPAWFRRPDGVLVAARFPDEQALFERRGYKPVRASDATKAIRSGKARKLAQQQKADSDRMDAEAARREEEKKIARRQAAARSIVNQAGLQTSPPAPPQAGPEADQTTAAERPPQEG
jgi:hypothetical protein